MKEQAQVVVAALAILFGILGLILVPIPQHTNGSLLLAFGAIVCGALGLCDGLGRIRKRSQNN